ncbi:MAG: serine hydrolase domain-containing protein [Candidatus Limnocylindrales bacterium]
MANPAATSPLDPGRPRPDRRRTGRRAGALIAAVAGLAVLGVGFSRSATGLAGPSPEDLAWGSAGAPIPAPSSVPGSPVRPTSGSSSGPGGSTRPASPSPRPGGSSGPQLSPGPAPVEVRLQATLDRVRAKLGIPGVSATILFPNGTSWTGASGLAVVATKTKVLPDTAFAFASVSKTFTSALIVQLADEGRLRLSDPAAGLLPPLRLAIDRRITVGMLLNHTSGLADYFLNPKIDAPLQARPNDAWTIDRTLRYVGKRLAPPGTAWHYSNTNYLLLGLIAERLTGQSLAEAIRTRLLDPTSLAATWYEGAEPPRAGLAHGYRQPGTKVNVRPIDLDDGSGVAPFRSVISAAAGAGSIAGTSGDLAQWGRALYTGRVLGPAGTAQLLSGFTKTTNYLDGVVYGYGVQAFTIDGHPSLGHSGRLLGFRSALRHFPLDGLTIAVLTNQSRSDPGLVVRALLGEALIRDAGCAACPQAR